MTLGVRKQCLALKVSDETRCSINALFDEAAQEHLLVCQVHNSEKFLNQLTDHKITHSTSQKDLEIAYKEIRKTKRNKVPEKSPKTQNETQMTNEINLETAYKQFLETEKLKRTPKEMTTRDFLEILKLSAPAFLLIAVFYNFFQHISKFNYFEYANLADFFTDIFNPRIIITLGLLIGILALESFSIEIEKWIDKIKLRNTRKARIDTKKQLKKTKSNADENLISDQSTGESEISKLSDEINNFNENINTLTTKQYKKTFSSLSDISVAFSVLVVAVALSACTLLFSKLAIRKSNPHIIRFTDQNKIGGEFNLIKVMDKYTILEKNGLIHVFPNGMVKSISYQSKTESSSAFSTFIILDESLPTNEGITNSKENHFQTTIELESKSVFQGSSFLLLPFFTNEVSLASQTGFTDEVPEFTQLKNLVFKLGKNKNFSTITITTKNASGKSVNTEYLSQLKKSLFICAANAKKEKIDFEIDVLGFASSDPFEGIYRSLPDDKNKSLNHILAESRRAAIIEKLGFNETGAIENSEGASIFLIKGPLQETSCLLYTSPSPRDRQKSRMPSSA